jgi:hypothetical protein
MFHRDVSGSDDCRPAGISVTRHNQVAWESWSMPPPDFALEAAAVVGSDPATVRP